MREDVFAAALRATARVAFSVALVSGCSSADESAPAESNEEAIKQAKLPRPSKTPTSCTDAGAAPAPSCGDQLDALTAAKDKWWADLNAYYADGGTTTEGEPTRPDISADTKQCCQDELNASGFRSPHRDACCQLAWTWEEAYELGGGISAACTPWGPPVPPAMPREAVLA